MAALDGSFVDSIDTSSMRGLVTTVKSTSWPYWRPSSAMNTSWVRPLPSRKGLHIVEFGHDLARALGELLWR